jgi:uncharacterized protein (DUF1697 family)
MAAGTYAAMLRGINVGGRNRVAMADLAALVSSLGFDDVATYVQSGNVVFRGTGASPTVAGRIADRITADLGLSVAVLVRNKRELAAILSGNPYSDAGAEPTLHHITLLAEKPVPDNVAKLAAQDGRFGEDHCQVLGQDVYLYCPGGYGNTKLNNAYLERNLDVVATTRNWRTLLTLADLCGVPIHGS